MSTGPYGLPEQCQLAIPGLPALAQCGTQQWLKAAVSDPVDLCPWLFTPRASCHAPEPRSSNKALCPLCTCSTSWSFLKAPCSRQSWITARSYPHTLILVTKYKCSCTIMLCVLICHQNEKTSHTQLLSVFEIKTNILLQICISSTQAVSQSSCWTHCTCFYLSICPESVSRKIQLFSFSLLVTKFPS